MATAALGTTNLYSQAYANLKDHINKNLTDPRNGQTSSSRKWIYSIFPDTKSREFLQRGYPFMVIESPDISDDAITLSRGFKDNTVRFMVTIYSKYKQSTALTQLDTLSNQMMNKLRTTAATDILEADKMFNLKVSSSGIVDEDISQQRIISRAFLVEVNVQLDV
jgi:hypothetical protein